MPTRAKQARLILPSAAEAKPKVKELDHMHGLDTYDYGARQYDPLLCRWDRIDPLCEKYYGVSPYVYCMNNPVMNVDPDGRKVVLAKNSSNEFTNQFNKAIEYLRDKGASEVYEKLNDNPNITITISENNAMANYTNDANVSWNPLSAIFVTSGGQGHYLSPAIRLLHELGHQLHKSENLELYKENTKEDNTEWNTPEEKNNILSVETPAAIKCGEIPAGTISRDSHSGITYKTDSSTSRCFDNMDEENVQMIISSFDELPK